MSDEHANALAELASDRETPELASMKEIESIGKKHIFSDANYPYSKKMARAEYEEAKQQLQIFDDFEFVLDRYRQQPARVDDFVHHLGGFETRCQLRGGVRIRREHGDRQ